MSPKKKTRAFPVGVEWFFGEVGNGIGALASRAPASQQDNKTKSAE